MNQLTALTGVAAEGFRGYSVRALFDLLEAVMENKKAELEMSAGKKLFG